MTTKDAILKLADAVSGNTSANVATDVQALAVLAQAMTGGVPAEPLATVDDAIGYIADNYSGGGGVDVGPLALVGLIDDAPAVGGSIFISGAISRVRIGDAAIYGGGSAQGRFAAGLTLTTDDIPSDFADTMSAYVCTADESNKFATVEPWSGTLTRGDSEQGFPAYNWTFTMPELQAGEMLILYSHLAD